MAVVRAVQTDVAGIVDSTEHNQHNQHNHHIAHTDPHLHHTEDTEPEEPWSSSEFFVVSNDLVVPPLRNCDKYRKT